MRSNVIAAGIIAVGLIVAAIFNGGLYQMQIDDKPDHWVYAYRLNKLTGGLALCTIELGCHTLAEGKPMTVDLSALKKSLNAATPMPQK